MKKEKSNAPRDEELLDLLVKTGETKYLELIYDRYANRVYYRCLNMLADKQEAEDVCHDVFLRLFLKAKGFKGRSKFSSWLFSITYNLCIDRLRKRNRIKIKEVPEDWEPPEEDNNEEELLRIKSQQLAKVLQALRTEERLLLLMKYQDELSVKAIAKVMQIGESAVKMRLKRAREHALAIYQKNMADTFD